MLPGKITKRRFKHPLDKDTFLLKEPCGVAALPDGGLGAEDRWKLRFQTGDRRRRTEKA